MTTVANHAANTPDTSTPKPHAWGVRSSPIVRSNTHAAATDTTNWKARMSDHDSMGVA